MPNGKKAGRAGDGRRPRLVLLAIVIASIAIRAGYFVQLNSTPLIHLDELDQTDMHYYDGWGRAIAEGDWLSRNVHPPLHSWHLDIAARYLEGHPMELAGSDRPSSRAASQALWDRWLDYPRFYQDPLYPYLIGVIYRVCGTDARYVLILQLGLGVLTNVLIWVVCRRVFGDTVAGVAGILAVSTVPLVYHELILLKESTIVFAGFAIVWLVDWAAREQRIGRYVLLGAALGAACLLKSTFGLVGAGIVGVLLWRGWREPRGLVHSLGGLAAGAALAFTPLVARNVAVGVSPLALASTGPLTFAIANQVNYPVDAGFFIDDVYAARAMGETSGRGWPLVARTIRGHNLATLAAGVWRKADRAWHWYEIPNNDNFYYMRRWSAVLQWLPLTFWAIAPLACVGLWAGRPRARAWPLYVLAGSALAPLVIFYVLARFRTALIAALIPFAALAIVELVGWVRGREYRKVLLAVATMATVAAWSGRPASRDQPLVRSTDWMLPYLITFRAEIEKAQRSGDPARAAALYLDYFQYEPDEAALLTADSRNLVIALSRMHDECARALQAAGQFIRAQAQEQRAQRLRRLTRD